MINLYKYEDIEFRKADRQDLNDLLELKNESWFGTHTVTLANSISQEKWLESISNETHSPKNLMLIAETTNDGHKEQIGVFKILHIDWQSRRAEAGWDIYRYCRGKGYGKQVAKAGVDFCFKILNLRRLDAQILANNEASQKCAAEAGFEKEGVQKQAIFKLGNYVDNYLYGILNPSFS